MKLLIILTHSVLSLSRCEYTENGCDIQRLHVILLFEVRCEYTENGGDIQHRVASSKAWSGCECNENVNGYNIGQNEDMVNKKKRNYGTISFTDKSHKEEVKSILHDDGLQALMPDEIKGKSGKMLLWAMCRMKETLENRAMGQEGNAHQQDNNQEYNSTDNDMNNEREFDVSALQQSIQSVLLEKAESEMDIRRGELTVKKINAMANLEKAKLEFMKLQLEQKRVEMEERRLSLEEIQAKYNIASDLANKSLRIQSLVGKTMLGLFPAEDKQVCQIMEAAKKVSELKKE